MTSVARAIAREWEARSLPPRRARGAGCLHHAYSLRVGPIVVRAATANSKLARVELVENSTECLRPVPVAPFVAATYAPIKQSCPNSCVFKAPAANGLRPCYADAGFARGAIRKLEEKAHGMSALRIAKAEAEAIDRLFAHGVPQDGARGGRDLRLHVSGDARTPEAARVLAGAAERWLERGGGSVWTFSHAWFLIPREAWGPISVLASVDYISSVWLAMEMRYAPALVVPRHAGPRSTDWGGLRFVPCPAQTSGRTCAECRLCLDRDLVKMGVVITFAAHGAGAPEARRRLAVVR